MLSWTAVTLLDRLSKAYKQELELPTYAVSISRMTSEYEEEIRRLWNEFKNNPTKENAKLFAQQLSDISGRYWEDLFIEILDIEDISNVQRDFVEDQLDEHRTYINESLLPDIIKAIDEGVASFDSFDYRVAVLYAGALWKFGFLSTVTWDGAEFRDLADVFIFAGPKDERNCTGDRGCDQHVNQVYTVAEIIARDIIPGRLQCLTNCRHMLLPIASPLNREKHLSLKGGPGSGNFGHTGRPGKVGGSAPSKTSGGLVFDLSLENKEIKIIKETQNIKPIFLPITTDMKKRYRELYDFWVKQDSTDARKLESLERSATVPPLIGSGDKNNWWITDGVHRAALASKRNMDKVPVYLVQRLKHLPGKIELAEKHLRGRHDQLTHGRKTKVWSGEPVEWSGKKLTKLQVGEIGENLTMRILSEQMGTEFTTLNEGLNNAPIDVGGDHLAVEVKTGLASNGKSAQHWRATIGQPGKEEAALIKQMGREEKRAHNQYKSQQILKRKNDMLKEMSEIAGSEVKPVTMGIILHPDGTRGDVYRFDGFHLRIPWKKAEEIGEYLGSYDVQS